MQGERKGQGWRAIDANVGGRERLASMFLGGGLIAFALSRRRPLAKLLLLPGVLLLARGRSGRSLLYTLFDVSTVPGARERRESARGREPRTRGEEAAAEGAAATYAPSPDAPHPQVPGTHQHPVPPTDLGVPSVQVTEKLMSEIASGAGGGEAETEPER